MRKKEKFVVVYDKINDDYRKFIIDYFPNALFIPVEDILNGSNDIEVNNINLLLFIDGPDINPNLYNDKHIHPTTKINRERDSLNKNMYNYFPIEIPRLGICRGAHFLTAMQGGKIIQNVEGHDIEHEIHTETRVAGIKSPIDDMVLSIDMLRTNKNLYTYKISSTHHQMMFPYNLNKKSYKILAWSKYHMSDYYEKGNGEQYILPSKFLEPEIVFYQNGVEKSLCIQGHPEFKDTPTDTKNLCHVLIHSYLL